MRWFPCSLAAVLMIASFSMADPGPATRPTTQPTFEELPAMELAGIAIRATPGSDLFGKLWDNFPTDVEDQPGIGTHPYCYGLSLFLPSTKDKHEFSYVAAGQVIDAAKVPLHLLRLSVPAGTYAVFKLQHGIPEGLPEFGPLFNYIYTDWLPNSDYVPAAPMNIERYAVKENTIAILIPVKKK